MDQTKEIDIDLKKIFFMMRKKVVYILLFTLLGGIAAGCFTEFFIDQKYTAKISLYVYSDMDQLSTQSSISYNDYTAATGFDDPGNLTGSHLRYGVGNGLTGFGIGRGDGHIKHIGVLVLGSGNAVLNGAAVR
jgi:hypothetical protein